MANDKKNTSPPASGIRQTWEDLPQKIRGLVEEQLGSKVINTATQSGGFSPGIATRLYLADGRIVFLKAIGTNINTTSIAFHRREIKINAQLPTSTPAPRLLWSYDDADDTEWVAMLFENVEGHNPAVPWRDDDLQRVVQAMIQLSETLTPSPLASDTVSSASDYFATRIRGWEYIKADATFSNQLDAWSQRHLDTLCSLEKQAPAAVVGDTLVHFDIRADNIVISQDAVWVVDWPHACLGASWLDAIAFAPSVAMQGGVSPEDFIQQYPACQQADPDAITAAVASIAGMFTHKSFLPAPSGLPTLRDFQAAQGVVAREWLAQRANLA